MTIDAVITNGLNWEEMMLSKVRWVGGSSFNSKNSEALADTVLFSNVHGIPKIVWRAGCQLAIEPEVQRERRSRMFHWWKPI